MSADIWICEKKYIIERIAYLKALVSKFGDEVIKIAALAKRKINEEKMRAFRKEKAEAAPKDVFMQSAFWEEGSVDKSIMEFEIIEDNDTAFEVRVTKCKYAELYKELRAADIGYALCCDMDFYEARAFDSKLELKRSKTLMMGDDCCNHRYILKK
jgi:hypothetical protein